MHSNFKENFTNMKLNYLDVIFIYGDTFAECRDAVLATVNFLLIRGFSIHPQKLQLIAEELQKI